MQPSSQSTDVAGLASAHGLTIDPASVRFNEAGLDYQIAFVTDAGGVRWVLRIPRRADVSAKIVHEARILDLVKHDLTVRVPNWEIQSHSLVAYRELPGSPGMTLSEAGEPTWHFDMTSAVYARSFGLLLAELQDIDPAKAGRFGIPSSTAEERRDEFLGNLRKVEQEFTIAAHLRADWEARLADDGLWPEDSTFTHGELYPAHLLLAQDATILSVLDWTTARFGDPTVDLAIHHALSTPGVFQVTLDAFAEAGGTVPTRLIERCIAHMAASPIAYALFAMTTGETQHLEIAAAGLNP